MPWDVKAKDDSGAKLLEVILTNGWLTNLYRNHLLHYHSTIAKLIKRDKNDKKKGRKEEEIKKWEKLSHSIMTNLEDKRNRRNKRLKLAMLLEDYSVLFEDQPALIGPRILMIMTLLALASSEINWLVVHQAGSRDEGLVGIYTTQETIRYKLNDTKIVHF